MQRMLRRGTPAPGKTHHDEVVGRGSRTPRPAAFLAAASTGIHVPRAWRRAGEDLRLRDRGVRRAALASFRTDTLRALLARVFRLLLRHPRTHRARPPGRRRGLR